MRVTGDSSPPAGHANMGVATYVHRRDVLLDVGKGVVTSR